MAASPTQRWRNAYLVGWDTLIVAVPSAPYSLTRDGAPRGALSGDSPPAPRGKGNQEIPR